jgi:hypothetical protein
VEPQGCDKDDELVQVMRRLATGDEAAVVTLYERYGSSIAAAVRHVARSRPGQLDDDDVGGAVLDVCFELARVAGGWSPAGGALPWVWARHRVAGAVDRALGQQAQSLDDQRAEVLDRLAAGVAPGPSGDEPSLLDTLNRLASHGPATEPSLVDAAAVTGSGDGGRASRVDAPAILASGSGHGGRRSLVDAAAVTGSGDHARTSLVDAAAVPGPGDGAQAASGSRGAPSSVGASTRSAPLVAVAGRAPAVTAPRVLDLTEPEPAGATPAPAAGAGVDRVGSVGVGLLAEALDRGGVSTRDRELLLEYAYEKHSGNAAPATAVAPLFDMREVSVRQAARRTRERLLRLAASEERFAPLADLPLLA